MSWLAGCWSGETDGRVVEERWLPLRAGTLVGASRVSRGERTLSVELAMVHVDADSLHARVEGPGDGGRVQALDFRYRREPACR